MFLIFSFFHYRTNLFATDASLVQVSFLVTKVYFQPFVFPSLRTNIFASFRCKSRCRPLFFLKLLFLILSFLHYRTNLFATDASLVVGLFSGYKSLFLTLCFPLPQNQSLCVRCKSICVTQMQASSQASFFVENSICILSFLHYRTNLLASDASLVVGLFSCYKSLFWTFCFPSLRTNHCASDADLVVGLFFFLVKKSMLDLFVLASWH